eukprot:3651512-Pleurochrysis_carterae.AAC.1
MVRWWWWWLGQGRELRRGWGRLLKGLNVGSWRAGGCRERCRDSEGGGGRWDEGSKRGERRPYEIGRGLRKASYQDKECSRGRSANGCGKVGR